MADLVYKLVVDMSTKGSLTPALEKVGKSGGDIGAAMSKVKEAASSVAGSLSGAFTSAVEGAAELAAGLAKVGAVAAGGAVAYGVAKLNNELEQTKISLGAILNAQGMSNGMTDAMGKSSDIVKEMRKDAAALPGEFKDLLNFFKLGATPGFQAGADIRGMESLSANAMAAAAATGVNMDQAAREFAQLLQGHAGGHNVFGQMLGLSGDKAKKFNAMTGADRLKALEGELGKFAPAIDVFSSSFNALSSTMIDNAKSVLQRATMPVFERVKVVLGQANTWFDANQTKVGSFVDKVGEKLVYAFEVGRIQIEAWFPAIKTFAEGAYNEIAGIWHRVAPLVEKVGGLIRSEISSPDVFKHLGGVGAAYAGVKAIGAVAPMASGAADMLGVGMLGPAAVVAAIGLAQVASVLHVLADDTSIFHSTAVASAEQSKSNLAGIADSMGKVWEKVGPLVARAADAFGTLFLTEFEIFTTLVGKVAGLWVEAGKAADFLVERVDSMVKSLSGGALTVRGLLDADPPEGGAARRHETKELLRAVRDESGSPSSSSNSAKQVHGGGGTSIQKVEIVVSSNQDPSRIARAVRDELSSVGRNPTSSRFVRNWGSTRP